MTRKTAVPTKCTFSKRDSRTDGEGNPIRTYEVRLGDTILGSVCGDSSGDWIAEAGLGGSAIMLIDAEGKAIPFDSRSQAAEALRAFAAGRAGHQADRGLQGAKSLDDLLAMLKALPEGSDADTTRLPTFGGDEPASTHGVFSWDAGRILVQGSAGWAIVARPEPEHLVHAVGSDGCIAVCGADLDDSAVASDKLSEAPNACPKCLADVQETHQHAFPNGCGRYWREMCPDCQARLGRAPVVHLADPERGTACCAIPSDGAMATRDASAVNCPDCLLETIRIAAAAREQMLAIETQNLVLASAVADIESALATRPETMALSSARTKVAGMIWRLVDAAAQLLTLSPDTDAGVRTPTGRGARLLAVPDVARLIKTSIADRGLAGPQPSLNPEQANIVANDVFQAIGRKPTGAEWAAAGFEWVGTEHKS